MQFLCWAIANQGFCYDSLVRLYTETCWESCNNKTLTHEGHSKRFVLVDSAGSVILHAKFHIYSSALLNEINNK